MINDQTPRTIKNNDVENNRDEFDRGSRSTQQHEFSSARDSERSEKTQRRQEHVVQRQDGEEIVNDDVVPGAERGPQANPVGPSLLR